MGLAAARLLERMNRQWEDLGDHLSVSFEFFPPNSPEMELTLWQSIQKLQRFRPRYVSVTYGANQSTRERTHTVIARLVAETDLIPAPHLTCIDATREELEAIIDRYKALGIQHIVALRGDRPNDYQSVPGGLHYAAELVRLLRDRNIPEVSVAAYPEVHPEARSARADLLNLKAKVEAGATQILTQFCFDNCAILRFRDKCAVAGISLPITPGILPVTNFRQVEKFSEACGTRIPGWMGKLYEGLEDDPDTRKLIGSSLALEQVKLLAREGISDFHFYTLNRADLSYAICHALGLAPGATQDFHYKRVANA